MREFSFLKASLKLKSATFLMPVFLMVAVLAGHVGWGQTPSGFLDFGNTANGTAATTLNTGFGGVRVGTGGGSFTIQNPGQSIGTAGELRGIAPTGGSINSVGLTSAEYGTAATTFTISFELHLSGGSSGTWYFFAGNGGSFGSAQSSAFTGADVFSGIQWTFGASNSITTNNRNGAAWNSTGITGTPFAQNTAYYVTIVGNNSASTVNYGASQSVAAYKYDLWVNGSLVGDDLAKAQLANASTINAFRFYGENSTSNVATLSVDNVRWYNTCVLPPTHLALIGVPSVGTVNTNLSTYTAEARSGSATGPVASSFTGAITIAKATGTGNISGTLSPNAIAGVASYSNTQFDAASTFTITASAASPIVNSAASGDIVVSASGGTPTQLAITSISPASPTSGSTFNVTVQARDGSNVAANVSASTAFDLTTNGNAGSIGGTTTGNILIGTSGVTVTGVTLSSSGTGVTLTATRTSGDVLTAGTSTGFTVLAPMPSIASSVVASNKTATTMDISWSSGGGARRIVVARLNATGAIFPTLGTTYSPSATGSFTGTTTTGTGNIVIYDGIGSSVSVTNLAAATAYAFDVYEYNGTTATANYSAAATSGAVSTFATEPTIQGIPTIGTVTSGSIVVSGYGGGNGTGVMLVAKAGGAVDAMPVDGNTYSGSLTFGNGTDLGGGNFVITTGGTVSATVLGLSSSSAYHFAVYEYNGTLGTTANFLTTSPGRANANTPAPTPTAASATTVNTVTRTPSNLDVSWTNGNGAGRIVVARLFSTTAVAPATGSTYTANNTFGSGSTTGANNFVVYNGTGNTVNVGGLTSDTRYAFDVYEYNGSGVFTAYSAAATGNGYTLATEPTTAASAVVFSAVSANGFTIGWTPGNGSGRIVVIKQGSAVDAAPVDGTGYTANTTFGNGTQIGTGNYVVYNSTGSSVTVQGLTANTTYYIAIYGYNGSTTGSTYNYLTSSFATGSQMTSDGSIATDYFRSFQTGPWASPGTWESSHDNNTWFGASLAPTSAANTITIRNSHNVTIGASATVDQVVIQSGSTLTYSTTTLTINDGTGDDIIVQDGGLFVVTAGTPALGSGTPTVKINTNGVIQTNNTSIILAIAAGSSNTNYIYDNGAILDYTTASNFASANTIFPGVASNVIPVLRLSNGMTNFGSGSATIINGIIEINAATSFSGAGTKTLRNGIRGSASFTQNSGAGQFIINGATADISGTGAINLNTGGLSISSGSVTTLSSNKTINSGTVTVSGTLAMGTNVLSGTTALTVASGGKLEVGSLSASGAIAGNITATGGVTLSAGSTVEFKGLAAQFAAARTFTNLTVNNASGVSLVGDVTVSGVLNFAAGKITTGANKVVVTSTGSVNGGGTGWVIGNLQKNISTGTSSKTFEIGGSTNYRPVTVDFNNVTTAGDLTAFVSQSNAVYSPLTGSGLNASALLQRYFTLTNSGIVLDPSTGSYDATFNFAATDVVGNPANYIVRKYNGSTWAAPVSSVSNYPTLSVKGIGFTAFSDFVIGEASPNPVLSANSLSGFGDVCAGTTEGPNSFTISGNNLSTADVTVGSVLAAYTYSLDDNTYSPSLTITQPGGTFSQLVYVKFSPSATQSYAGNIVVGGGGASSYNVAVSGNGVNTAPSVTTDAPATSITSSAATLPATIVSTGCTSITSYGVEYSTTNGFANGAGTAVAGSNLTAGSFTVGVTGLSANTVYYYKAYAANNGGTSYGSQQTFTTANLPAPVAVAASAITNSGFTANWNAVAGASSYLLDVSTSPTFGSTTPATDLLISEYVEGSSNNKYIEIFNGTGAAVDLSDYEIRLFANGASTATSTESLSGSLADGGTLVFRNSAASIVGTTGYATSAVANFNGDDALAIYKISTSSYVDIFGRIGNDPGTAWTSANNTTVDKTLVRKPTVINGITTSPTGTGSSAFTTLETEWTQYAIDDVSHLGAHTFTPPTTTSFVSGYENLSVAGTSQVVTGLTAGITYYYRVRAASTNSTSPNSNTISVTTCTPPAITSATAGASPICGNATTTLTANGVSGTNASVTWWTGSGGTGTPVGSGNTSDAVGPGTYYAYVTGDCGTAEASVTVNTTSYTITASAGSNGSISPVGAVSVNCGSDQLFTITPNSGYAVQDVLVDGISVGAVTTYNFPNVSTAHTITASFVAGCTPGNWIGGSGNWSDAANWSCNTVPASGTAITISAGSPVLDVDFTVANSLVLSGSGGLTIAPNKTLTISGSANFGNRPVTVVSNSTGTGAIGSITGSLNGASNVTVERYIPTAKRAWRLLSLPVTGPTLNQAWAAAPADPTQNRVNGSTSGQPTNNGTLITGNLFTSGAVANAAGFDWWQTGASSSIRFYTNSGSTGTWDPANNTPDVKAPADKQGYLLFVRGDRTVTSGSGTTTLRPTGSVKTGDQLVPVSTAFSHIVVGNPYASPFNFETMRGHSANASLVKDQFWIWDATYGTNGGYKLVIKNGSWNAIPSPYTAPPATPSVGNYQYIQSGEAFFVEPLSNGNLTISETDKETPASLPTIFDAPAGQGMLFTNLNQDNGSSQNLTDGVLAVFGQDFNKTTTDRFDIKKLLNLGENFSLIRNGSRLTMEALPYVSGQDTLYFNMSSMTVRNYNLQFKAVNMQAGLTARLEDGFTGKSETIGTNDGDITTYAFSVTSAAGSAAADRFRIVFKADQTLPLTLNSARAYQQGSSAVQVDWKATNERNLRSYEVEKSLDGRSFTKASTVAAKNSSEASYSWLDATAVKGLNYYRIKAISNDGTSSYSQVLLVNINNGKSLFSIYPNPAKAGKLSIQFSNMDRGQYELQLFNSVGQKILSRSIEHMGGSSSEELNLGSATAAGVYRVYLLGSNGISQLQTLVIQ